MKLWRLRQSEGVPLVAVSSTPSSNIFQWPLLARTTVYPCEAIQCMSFRSSPRAVMP